MSDPMTPAVPDPTVEALLHELWLRVHIRRFDGNEYPEGRPTYVSPERAVDCFYAGVMKSQHIIEQIAREHGINRVYDKPAARAAAPDALRVRGEALATELDEAAGDHSERLSDFEDGYSVAMTDAARMARALLEDGA